MLNNQVQVEAYAQLNIGQRIKRKYFTQRRQDFATPPMELCASAVLCFFA
ncbi:MAG: hypothetical protein ABJA78_02005 [Ferruginibacter sp.]